MIMQINKILYTRFIRKRATETPFNMGGTFVMCWAIWYYLYNLKNVKNTHGGVLILENFTKIDTPPWVFFTFFKLYKYYQIAQRISFFPKIIHMDGETKNILSIRGTVAQIEVQQLDQG